MFIVIKMVFTATVAQRRLNRRRRRTPIRVGDQVVIRRTARQHALQAIHTEGRRGECISKFRRDGVPCCRIKFADGREVCKVLTAVQKVYERREPLNTVINPRMRVIMRANPSMRGYVLDPPAADHANQVHVLFFDGGPTRDVDRLSLRVVTEFLVNPLL